MEEAEEVAVAPLEPESEVEDEQEETAGEAVSWRRGRQGIKVDQAETNYGASVAEENR